MITPARKRILTLLTNPFILAAIPAAALLVSIPVRHNPYILSPESNTACPENFYCIYCDLDGDGYSEKISAFDYPNGSGITVSRGAMIMNQWNISGTFGFQGKSTFLIPADCDGNGISELYIFSLKGDSVLLHSVKDPSDPGLVIRSRLIDLAGKGSAASDPRIVPAEPQDLDGDGRVELLFGITTGFSKHPRKVYAYYPGNDSLVASPPVGGFILGILQEDINNDGQNEIITDVYASGNIAKSEMQHHDQSAWLTVLDRNLEFMFDPVEFRGNFALATPMVMASPKGLVLDVLVSPLEQDSVASLVSFSPAGEVTGRTAIPVVPYTGFMTVNRKNEPVYAAVERERGIVLFDSHRELLGEIHFPGTPLTIPEDIDLDGIPEIVVCSFETGMVHVYRAGMRQPASADIGIISGSSLIFSVIRKKDEAPRIFIQAGARQYVLQYRRNQLYYISFGLYPLIYAGFIAFVLLVQKTQRRVLTRREEEMKKISELQLALIGNHLDPHFTLNALNSVLHLVEQSDREKTRDSLLKFSGLYRDMLLSAGKSRRHLGEEIEFCREYLALEKIRYGDRLDYSIILPPEINTELQVPKFVIQLFAENGVKHGIAGMEHGGKLEIIVRGADRDLTVEIRDNGIGRARAAEEQTGSTGKGMKLMTELFSLCNNYYEDRYSFSVTDLADTMGTPAGTCVTVSIHFRNEPVIIT